MSIDAIKQELAGLDADGRQQIIAYLVSINQRENPEYRTKMARKIDDNDPAHWLTLEEFDQKLSLREDEPTK
jgi:predicted SnoaL-like aldol condensation-catalyzing enzyme